MLSKHPLNRRTITFAAGALLSAGLAFLLPLTDAYVALRYGGPFLALTLLLLWLYCAAPALQELWGAARPVSGAVCGAIVVLVCSAVMFKAVPAKLRILDDELSLQRTALSMHHHREFVSADKGYWVGGEFTITNATLGKRPFFYPFLLSVVHDVTGYRTGNAFYLNFVLGHSSPTVFCFTGSACGLRRSPVLPWLRRRFSYCRFDPGDSKSRTCFFWGCSG